MKKIIAVLLICIAFNSCSNLELPPDDGPAEGNEKPELVHGPYSLTVKATMGADSKALSLDGNTLNVKWAATDQVSVFPAVYQPIPLGTLTAAASNTGSTTLTGTLKTAPAVGSNMQLLFPRRYWDYTGQKGVLLSIDDSNNSIEKKYDYALASVAVTDIDKDGNISAGTAAFESQQAIVKFTLTNSDGLFLIPANSLTIHAASGKILNWKNMPVPKQNNLNATCYSFQGSDSNLWPVKLIDGNPDTKWFDNVSFTEYGGICTCWFGTGSPVHVDSYTLVASADNSSDPGRTPAEWTLEASNSLSDGYITIATGHNNTAWGNSEAHSYEVDVPGTYQYFRLNVSSVLEGNALQLGELQLFHYNLSTEYGDLTITPDAASSEFTVALRNENDGSDTYTLTANISGNPVQLTKSGVTFQNGRYYAITLRLAVPPDSSSGMTDDYTRKNPETW